MVHAPGQRRFRRRSGRLWCRARSVSTGIRRRFRRRFWRRSGRLWCRARSGSTGFRRIFRRRFQEAVAPSQVQRVPGKVAEAKPGEVHLTHGNLAQVFPALASQHASERFIKIKCCGCWGYHRSLLFFPWQPALRTSGIGCQVPTLRRAALRAFGCPRVATGRKGGASEPNWWRL